MPIILKMPMINPNLGQKLQQSVVFDPLTGQSRVQTSVVPSLKRSINEEIRLRSGLCAPFNSYGDEDFFETGLPIVNSTQEILLFLVL